MSRRAPALSNFQLEKLSELLENVPTYFDPTIDPTTAQGDDRLVELLRSRLLARVPFHPDLFGTIEAITTSIGETWPQAMRPTLAIVLGECHEGYDGALACRAMPEHEVVSDSLVDPDDIFWEYLNETGETGSNLYLLNNPVLAHSQIRWRDPVGDRTVMSLPGAYDIR
jgi:hypothetical protein